MRSRFWILSVVICLTLASKITAQEDTAQGLTPEILYTSPVADIDAPITVLLAPVNSVVMCSQRDCLSYQASSDEVHFVDISSKPEIYKTIEWDDFWAWHATFSPNDKYAISRESDTPFFVLDVETGERLFDVSTDLDAYAPYWNKSSTQFVIHDREEAISEFWDVKSGKALFQTKQWGNWTEDETLIISYEADTSPYLFIYDVVTGTQIGQIDYGSPIGAVAVNSQNHDVLIVGEDISLWSLDRQEKIFTFSQKDDGIYAYNVPFQYAPDGSAIVIRNSDGLFGDKVWTVWDITNQKPHFTLARESNEEVFGPQWNSSSTHILADFRSPEGCEENCLYGSYIWDALTGEQIAKVTGLSSSQSYWVPNSTWIMSDLNPETLLIWDAKTGQALYELPHPEEIQYADWDFNHDGSKLVVWTDQQIYLWTLPQP